MTHCLLSSSFLVYRAVTTIVFVKALCMLCPWVIQLSSLCCPGFSVGAALNSCVAHWLVSLSPKALGTLWQLGCMELGGLAQGGELSSFFLCGVVSAKGLAPETRWSRLMVTCQTAVLGFQEVAVYAHIGLLVPAATRLACSGATGKQLAGVSISGKASMCSVLRGRSESA